MQRFCNNTQGMTCCCHIESWMADFSTNYINCTDLRSTLFIDSILYVWYSSSVSMHQISVASRGNKWRERAGRCPSRRHGQEVRLRGHEIQGVRAPRGRRHYLGGPRVGEGHVLLEALPAPAHLRSALRVSYLATGLFNHGRGAVCVRPRSPSGWLLAARTARLPPCPPP